jgi:hypothetical protein
MLTCRASDRGNPRLWSDCRVAVHVRDVNDHRPAFLEAAYRVSVPEDTVGGTPLLQVAARDEDGSPPNNYITYRRGHIT